MRPRGPDERSVTQRLVKSVSHQSGSHISAASQKLEPLGTQLTLTTTETTKSTQQHKQQIARQHKDNTTQIRKYTHDDKSKIIKSPKKLIIKIKTASLKPTSLEVYSNTNKTQIKKTAI